MSTVDNSRQISNQACRMTLFPEELQHQVRDVTNHVLVPLNIVLAVMSFVCNALVVYAVARTKSLQRPSILMLCSLAITDLLYAPYSFVSSIRILSHQHMCPDRPDDEVVMLGPLSALATLGNLAIISRDRHLAVKQPCWYRIHMTKPRVMKMISLPWLCSVVTTFLFYLSLKYQGGFPASLGRVASLSYYLICFFVITFSYLGIFCGKRPPEDALHIRAILEREKRMANTVGLILLVLVITFLPGLVTPLVLNAKGVPNIQLYRPVFGFGCLLNGLLNPLLNFGRSKEMRKALGKLLRCCPPVQPSSDAYFLQQQQQQQLKKESCSRSKHQQSLAPTTLLSSLSLTTATTATAAAETKAVRPTVQQQLKKIQHPKTAQLQKAATTVTTTTTKTAFEAAAARNKNGSIEHNRSNNLQLNNKTTNNCSEKLN